MTQSNKPEGSDESTEPGIANKEEFSRAKQDLRTAMETLNGGSLAMAFHPEWAHDKAMPLLISAVARLIKAIEQSEGVSDG